MTMLVSELLRFALVNPKVKCLLKKHAPELNVERIIGIVDSSASANLEIQTYNDYRKKYSTIIGDISSKLTTNELKSLKKHQRFIHLWVYEFFAETSNDEDYDDQQEQQNRSLLPLNCNEQLPQTTEDEDDNDYGRDEVDYESMDSEDCHSRNQSKNNNKISDYSENESSYTDDEAIDVDIENSIEDYYDDEDGDDDDDDDQEDDDDSEVMSAIDDNEDDTLNDENENFENIPPSK